MKWCDEYLDRVASQVRVRRIRHTLTEELRDHLECQRQAYLDEGLSDEEAQRRALLDMGDPLLVGGELDRAHRPQTPWTGMVALCGWLPFAALVLGIVGAFIGLYRRFLPMENRMGRLIGLAGTSTLAAQALLHFLSCFFRVIQQLCLPLLGQGNVMMLMDAAIVGMLLSVLRSAALPESLCHSDKRGRSGDRPYALVRIHP